jgi:TonB-linked SusC/RagA family outer membrane protein
MRWAMIVCLVALVLPCAAEAQQPGVVAGSVVDDAGAPLSGAQVDIAGLGLGTLANQQGRYRITGVPAGEITVRATLIGYATAERRVSVREGETVTADFRLSVTALELEGLVAVGYGTQQRINLSGAVAAVNVTEMAKMPLPNVSQALQGLTPGLQVLDVGGRPGFNEADILVRGRGTLGGTGRSRPLVLIDGFESDMNDLDIRDVESVSVLKDASSAAIYGSRAANGVILITTRRGEAREGRPTISYDGFYGMQDFTAWPEHVDVRTHMELTNVSYVNSGRAPKYSEEYIECTVSGRDPIKCPTTDWIRAQLTPAPIQQHTLRLTGGNAGARFALSGNFSREDGMHANSGATRHGLRLNTDFRASDRLTGGLDLAASRNWNLSGWNTTPFFFLIHDTPPTVQVQYPNGMWGWSDTNRNPVAEAHDGGRDDRTTWGGTATGRLNYDLIPEWVSVEGTGSVNYSHFNRDRWREHTEHYDYNNPTIRRVRWAPNQLQRTSSDATQVTLRALTSFGHTFLDTHLVSGVLGYEQIHQDNFSFYASRQEFYNNSLRQIDLGNAQTQTTSGSGSEWALRSVFGRANYSYLGRYLAEANFRYDGSSRFADESRFGFFPSFSVAWRISEEPFFRLGWINELKLRGSWGQLGNQDVGLYRYYSTISLDQPYFFGSQIHTGAGKTRLTNEALSWETTTVTNIGFDAAFLAGRLSLTGDLYERRTDDILLDLPIPLIVGMLPATENAGVVENKGWELALGWRDRVREFNYSVDFNLSDNRNEVVDLAGTGPYTYLYAGREVIMEGAPIRAYYGYEALGLFQSWAEIEAHAQQDAETEPGDVKWKDQNGDGIINDLDRVVIGNPHPRYMFGVNMNASWRSFDIGAFVQGVGKRDQLIYRGLAEGPIWENYTTTWHTDYWTPENPNARVPRPRLYLNHSTRNPSSWFITPASYAKLRNIQLGYTVPSLYTDRMGVQRIRLYVAGKNLWQWTNMEIGLDPEVAQDEANYYPQTKNVTFGMNITF